MNLPRAEKGLPINTSKTEVGRGYRQRIAKSRKLPGELSTIEQDESEQEEASLTPTNKSTLKKKSTPVKRKSSSETTKLPLPPPTLRSKSKNGKTADVVCMDVDVFIKLCISNYVFGQPYSDVKQQSTNFTIYYEETISQKCHCWAIRTIR